MSSPTWPRSREWWRDGETYLAHTIAAMPDDQFTAPSLLPGWTRGTLVAHLARNADALRNLVKWAGTGVETPMYPSVEARAAGIEASAHQSPVRLRADFADAAARLSAAAQGLSDEQWTATVRTAQGREVPAREIAWMRTREVWVHAVDLATGASFADVPHDCLEALVDDVVAMWQRRDESVDLVLVASDADREWRVGADGQPVTAPLADLVALVTGRSGTDRALPGWI